MNKEGKKESKHLETCVASSGMFVESNNKNSNFLFMTHFLFISTNSILAAFHKGKGLQGDRN